MEHFIDVIVGIVLIMILATICIIVLDDRAVEERGKLESQATTCIENGYDVYVDGMQVDGTAVDLSYYNITVNDETHKVLLTKEAKKTGSSFGFEYGG